MSWILILVFALICLAGFLIIHFLGTTAFLIIFGILIALVIAALVALHFLGKRAEKKQAEQKKMMDSMAQTVSMYIIDKKMMKLTEAGLPKAVIESTPKYARRFKMPIVKAKVGVKPVNFICDDQVFRQLLPKQEVKATVSGIYITSARRIRGPVFEPQKKEKKGLFRNLLKK